MLSVRSFRNGRSSLLCSLSKKRKSVFAVKVHLQCVWNEFRFSYLWTRTAPMAPVISKLCLRGQWYRSGRTLPTIKVALRDWEALWLQFCFGFITGAASSWCLSLQTGGQLNFRGQLSATMVGIPSCCGLRLQVKKSVDRDSTWMIKANVKDK